MLERGRCPTWGDPNLRGKRFRSSEIPRVQRSPAEFDRIGHPALGQRENVRCNLLSDKVGRSLCKGLEGAVISVAHYREDRRLKHGLFPVRMELGFAGRRRVDPVYYEYALRLRLSGDCARVRDNADLLPFCADAG